MDYRCTSTSLFLEMTAATNNKDDDFKLNYYWRIAERCGWDGLAPLGARQGLADF